jgi:putative DNA primase/helicase
MNGKIIPLAHEDDNESPPVGFQLRDDGMYYRSCNEKGAEWLRLCSPLRVLALARDSSSSGWGKFVELTDYDMRVHRKIIPARMLASEGRELIADLMDSGLQLAPGHSARIALLRLLTLWTSKARVLTATRLGWVGDSFTSFLVGPHRCLGSEVAMPLPGIATAAEAMRERGTVAEWRNEVAQLCAGNTQLIAGISLAFAGPLLKPLQLDGGGLHLRGPSSRGKTTILRAAVSVWGEPAMLQSWRATDNGLEGVAATFNDTLCALDEIGEAPARSVSEMAYMLANGTGKARATKTGNAAPQQRWRVMVLSSGEISIAEKIREGGILAKAGTEVRILDIPADRHEHGCFNHLHASPDAAAYSQRVANATAQFYGSAGQQFVAALIESLETNLDCVRESMARTKEWSSATYNCSGEGQIQRAVTRIALIGAAGELATRFGLTGWRVGSAEAAARDLLDLMIAERGGVEPQEKRDAIVRTRAFLSEHGSARFEELECLGRRERIPNHAGWRDAEWFYISHDSWKAIHQGIGAQQAARYLQSAGHLRVEEVNRLTIRMPGKVTGRPRVYAVSQAILGDDRG